MVAAAVVAIIFIYGMKFYVSLIISAKQRVKLKGKKRHTIQNKIKQNKRKTHIQTHAQTVILKYIYLYKYININTHKSQSNWSTFIHIDMRLKCEW